MGIYTIYTFYRFYRKILKRLARMSMTMRMIPNDGSIIFEKTVFRCTRKYHGTAVIARLSCRESTTTRLGRRHSFWRWTIPRLWCVGNRCDQRPNQLRPHLWLQEPRCGPWRHLRPDVKKSHSDRCRLRVWPYQHR